MLVMIRCDKFAPEFRAISFQPGLNTILGNSDGSNAIGKTTLLEIIDFAFGGNEYAKSYNQDISQFVGNHIISMTFDFDGILYYFCRFPHNPTMVIQCDKDGRTIKKMTLDDYHEFLFDHYRIDIPGLDFDEIRGRFFRIYGQENTTEKYPFQRTFRESSEKAVDFLLVLFGYKSILTRIRSMEEILGSKVSDFFSKKKRKPMSFEKIEENEKAIQSMQGRLEKLMRDNEDVQLSFFGLNPDDYQKIQEAQVAVRGLVQRRDRLKSHVTALRSRFTIEGEDITEEFQSLLDFFPSANLRAFSEIEEFHRSLRQILNEDLNREIDRLESVISRCDREIDRLRNQLKDSGVARQMAEQVLSECVQIRMAIMRLREENDELEYQRQLQEDRELAERKMEALIKELEDAISDVQSKINIALKELNAVVTANGETEPTLEIKNLRRITFQTSGNTSEGTAFKSMLLYDLAILRLTSVPALIHDSNLFKSLDAAHLAHILKQYTTFVDKQIFIAYDKAELTNSQTRAILEDTARVHLSVGHELFGKSWSNLRSAGES